MYKVISVSGKKTTLEELYENENDFLRLDHAWDPEIILDLNDDFGGELVGQRVNKQGPNYKRKKITKDRNAGLNSAGFVWVPFELEWNKMLELYKLFKKQFGKEPKDGEEFEGKPVGQWVEKQRQDYNSKNITRDRIEALNSAEFVWDPLESEWNEMLESYKLFKRQFDKEPKNGEEFEGKGIAFWISAQRLYYKNNTLTRDRIEKLNSAGMVWDQLESESDQMPELYKSFNHQFSKEVKIKDDIDRIIKLNSTRFVRDTLESEWNHMLEVYIKFKNKFGEEPKNGKEFEGKPVGQWVNKQRQDYKSKNITRDRIEALNSAGFVWDPLESEWNKMLELYKIFERQFGKAPKNNQEFQGKKIGYWVSTQRNNYKNDRLTSGRIEKLNSAGFKWDAAASNWNQMLELYISFKRQFRREVMSKDVFRGRKIGNWVCTQRNNYKNDRLTKNQIKELNSAGFVWDLYASDWNQMLELYISFKRQFSREVKSKDEFHGKKIGFWAVTQRKFRRNESLGPEKIKLLDKAGFIW